MSASLNVSDGKESPSVVADGEHPEAEEGGPGSLQPMHMQLFSTWEVRKAPVNCVPRLCTLQVTRLEVTRPLETGLGSMVLAASMKTPHRFLRSNEIIVPPSGILTIPLELTFSLQYPHFLKRGGNVLQIRLQRRKRVRNRPLGGYKNLAIGLVEMSQVLQHSFQGEVKLYAEKVSEHMAIVTVGSLTSTAVDLDRREHMAEASSDDEDEDMIFSDDHIGSDSESGDNEQQSYGSKKKFKPSSAVMRLLHLNRPSKSRRHRHGNAMMMEEEEGDVFHGSSVAFASSASPSDSEEEEEEGGVVDATPQRPTLSPFFGSDRCSMVSLPTSAKSAEVMARLDSESPLKVSHVYSSLERAIHSDRVGSPILFAAPKSTAFEDTRTWDLSRGCIWCVSEPLFSSPVATKGTEGQSSAEGLVKGLEARGEVVAMCLCGPARSKDESQEAIRVVLSICACVHTEWEGKGAFCVALVGGDSLVSSALQALAQSICSPDKLRFAIIPIVPGLMSTRLSTIDDKYQLTFPADGKWLEDIQECSDCVVEYVKEASSSLPLPLAQVMLQRPTAELGGSSFSEQSFPFMCSVNIGCWDLEPDVLPLPTSPVYGATTGGGGAGGGATGGGGSSGDTPELILEYWSTKGQKEKLHPGSVKVRSVIVSYVDNVLNVTATKDKKSKGIRIRKSKESDVGGSIVSLTTTQLVCRPAGKAESVSVMVDGVEREEVSLVKLQANWDLTPNRTFSMAVSSDVGTL